MVPELLFLQFERGLSPYKHEPGDCGILTVYVEERAGLKDTITVSKMKARVLPQARKVQCVLDLTVSTDGIQPGQEGRVQRERSLLHHLQNQPRRQRHPRLQERVHQGIKSRLVSSFFSPDIALWHVRPPIPSERLILDPPLAEVLKASSYDSPGAPKAISKAVSEAVRQQGYSLHTSSFMSYSYELRTVGVHGKTGGNTDIRDEIV